MTKTFHFYHGEYGWIGNTEKIEWDEDEDQAPTDDEAQAAFDHWMKIGLNNAFAEHQNGYADYMEHMY